nr:MAG TPA_asm: hypothetical protein [Caudoviricetes sp.]
MALQVIPSARHTHRDPLIPDLPYQVLIADIRVRSQHDLLIGMTLKYEIAHRSAPCCGCWSQQHGRGRRCYKAENTFRHYRTFKMPSSYRPVRIDPRRP